LVGCLTIGAFFFCLCVPFCFSFLFRLPCQIWLDNDLDMRLKPYKCIATGVNDNNEGVGMIEVVMGSDTTSGIQLKYGGGAIGALKLEPLDLFIRAHNSPGVAYDRAVDNFIRSCAGYCVATFVLGIGDRHNGNIMVTREGHLFRQSLCDASAWMSREGSRGAVHVMACLCRSLTVLLFSLFFFRSSLFFLLSLSRACVSLFFRHRFRSLLG